MCRFKGRLARSRSACTAVSIDSEARKQCIHRRFPSLLPSLASSSSLCLPLVLFRCRLTWVYASLSDDNNAALSSSSKLLFMSLNGIAWSAATSATSAAASAAAVATAAAAAAAAVAASSSSSSSTSSRPAHADRGGGDSPLKTGLVPVAAVASTSCRPAPAGGDAPPLNKGLSASSPPRACPCRCPFPCNCDRGEALWFRRRRRGEDSPPPPPPPPTRWWAPLDRRRLRPSLLPPREELRLRLGEAEMESREEEPTPDRASGPPDTTPCLPPRLDDEERLRCRFSMSTLERPLLLGVVFCFVLFCFRFCMHASRRCARGGMCRETLAVARWGG